MTVGEWLDEWLPGKRIRKTSRRHYESAIRVHDLRHGAATLALAGGADMKTVQEMLGHSSITITSDIYTSVLPEVAHRAAETAAKLVPRKSTGTDGHTSGTHEAQSSAALQLVTDLGKRKDPGQEA
jgi:hypothetical protein